MDKGTEEGYYLLYLQVDIVIAFIEGVGVAGLSTR